MINLIDDLYIDSICKDFLGSAQTNLKTPKVFILGGQSGSGKSELTSIIMEELKNDVVIINGDEFRKLHPNYEEFQKEDIKNSAIKTSEFSGKVVEALMDRVIKLRCNVIVEGTFRTAETPIKTLKLFKDNGYYTNVFIKSTSKRESWKNCLERYEEMQEVSPQTARFTPKEIHNLIVDKLAKNVYDVYKSGLVDNLEIYTQTNKIFDSKTDDIEGVENLINENLNTKIPQLKLLTLDDCNLSNLEDIKLIGTAELSIIDDEVLCRIIKKFDEDGKKEIFKMMDRGQISQRQAERVLGDNEYKRVGKLVPCEWDFEKDSEMATLMKKDVLIEFVADVFFEVKNIANEKDMQILQTLRRWIYATSFEKIDYKKTLKEIKRIRKIYAPDLKNQKKLSSVNNLALNELEIFGNKVSFEFHNGWFVLVYKLAKDIEELCKLVNCELPVVKRVKSKYATLRFDYYFKEESNVPKLVEKLIDSLIYEAEDKSSRICEVCGKEGQLRTTKTGSWDFTVCDEHKEDYLTMEEFKEYRKRHTKDEIIDKLKELKPLYKEKGLELICIDDNKDEDYRDLDLYYRIDMEIIEQYTKSVQEGKWVVTQLMEFFDEIKSHFRIEITFYAEKCLKSNYKIIYIEK